MSLSFKPSIYLKGFICLFLALICSACSQSDEQLPEQTFQLNFVDGQSSTLYDLKGQWLVVNYWAEWCKPCIKEIPELNRLNDNHDNIRVIGVNYDKPAQKILQKQIQALNVGFPNLLLAKTEPEFIEFYELEKPRALPATLIINPQLQLKSVLLGPQDEQSLLEAIKQLEVANGSEEAKGSPNS